MVIGPEAAAAEPPGVDVDGDPVPHAASRPSEATAIAAKLRRTVFDSLQCW